LASPLSGRLKKQSLLRDVILASLALMRLFRQLLILLQMLFVADRDFGLMQTECNSKEPLQAPALISCKVQASRRKRVPELDRNMGASGVFFQRQ
jgi:hypothetical protein